MHDKVRKAKEEGCLRESEKKSQACCVSFKLQTLKSCLILRMPKLQILHPVQTIKKCTQNIQFQNSFLVRLSFLWPNSDQNNSTQGSTFRKKSWGQLASKFSFLVARTSILVAKNCLSSRKNRIQYTKGLLINLNKIVNIKLQKVNPEYKGRPSTKQAT